MMQLFWKTVWRVLKKLKIELRYDPAVALLGIYPKETNIVIQRGTCTPVFIAAMSIIAKLWKESRCSSTEEWIKMMCFVNIHAHTLEYYSAIKKNEILPFAIMWMEPEYIMLSKISQRKTNNPIISLICEI